MGKNMTKLLERIIKREEAIIKWLKMNNFEKILNKADEVISSLDRASIKKEFSEEIKSALAYCAENTDIQSLDFEWYYNGEEIGGALAYGYYECNNDGELSKTDLGPYDLPGIETNIEHIDVIDEDFAEIPVNKAINLMVEHINPIIDDDSCDAVITDYFQIWNYKLACEVCDEVKESKAVIALKSRAPFWVTMSRHERWAVPIMFIE
jgi:hypothetical protein